MVALEMAEAVQQQLVPLLAAEVVEDLLLETLDLVKLVDLEEMVLLI